MLRSSEYFNICIRTYTKGTPHSITYRLLQFGICSSKYPLLDQSSEKHSLRAPPLSHPNSHTMPHGTAETAAVCWSFCDDWTRVFPENDK